MVLSESCFLPRERSAWEGCSSVTVRCRPRKIQARLWSWLIPSACWLKAALSSGEQIQKRVEASGLPCCPGLGGGERRKFEACVVVPPVSMFLLRESECLLRYSPGTVLGRP